MAAIKLYRGSDKTFTIRYRDSAGAALPYTGTPEMIFAHPRLVGAVTLDAAEAALGRVGVRIVWNDQMPMGEEMGFRVRVMRGGDRKTTPEIVVVVK